MTKTSIALALAAVALLPGTALAQAAVSPAAESRAAQQAMDRGDAAAAEASYTRVLAMQPNDADALVGRGNARAFQKKYAEAQADFQAVLARDPRHLGALVGLGHTLAWSARYAEAMAQFERALAVAPDNVDAARGAAFTDLWRGDAKAAETRFERLVAQAPQDRGAQEGLAQARRVLAGGGPQVEAILWYGRTSLPGGVHETGLRFAELGFWPYDKLRLFARYDDGLSRDNAALARENRNAALKSVGGYLRWHQNYGTLVEIGTREFPDGVDQTLYRAEQTFYLDRGYEVKVGGWRGPRSDDRTEWLAYVGAAVPWAEHWRFEPTVYYSRSGLPGGNETRFAFATTYDSRAGWDATVGLAGGRAHADGQNRTVREAFVRASYQVQPWLRLQLLARRESVSGGDDITVVALGTLFTWK